MSGLSACTLVAVSCRFISETSTKCSTLWRHVLCGPRAQWGTCREVLVETYFRGNFLKPFRAISCTHADERWSNKPRLPHRAPCDRRKLRIAFYRDPCGDGIRLIAVTCLVLVKYAPEDILHQMAQRVVADIRGKVAEPKSNALANKQVNRDNFLRAHEWDGNNELKSKLAFPSCLNTPTHTLAHPSLNLLFCSFTAWIALDIVSKDCMRDEAMRIVQRVETSVRCAYRSIRV